MVPSNGICMGVTPNGVAGSSSPSIRSATALPMTWLAYMSVPVGRCGPCCSTLPAGRMTSGFFLSCCAISGWVRSMKWRVGSITLFLKFCLRFADDIGDFHALTVAVDRAQRRVDDGDGDVAVVSRQFA